jgi:hypothetical protein
MIVYKLWVQKRKIPFGNDYVEWRMEGWFLFGIIPLLKRDLTPRGKFGK